MQSWHEIVLAKPLAKSMEILSWGQVGIGKEQLKPIFHLVGLDQQQIA